MADIPVIIDSLAWVKKADIGPVNEYLLRNKLTFVPRKLGPEEPKPIRLFATTNDHIGVPRFFWYSQKRALFPTLTFKEDLSRVSLGEEIGETSRKFTLRDDQAEMVEACKSYFERQIGGIVCAFTAFGKCGRNFLVPTDCGLLKIEDIVDKKLACRVLTKSGTWNRITGWMSRDSDSVLKIKSSRGYSIEVTDEHPILVVRKPGFVWVHAKDVEIGDWLVRRTYEHRECELLNFNFNGCSIELNQDASYCLGVLTGDGNVTCGVGNVTIGSYSTAITYAIALEQAFGFNKKIKARDNHYMVNCGDKEFMFILQILGMRLVKAPEKTIPESIMKSGRKVISAFIRGLFDCDASVLKTHTIEYSSSSLELSTQIHNLLLGFGISSSLSSTPACYRKNGKTIHCHDRHRVSIGRNSLKKYQESIGFSCKEKHEKLIRMIDSSLNYGSPNLDVIPINPWALPIYYGKKSKSTVDRFGTPAHDMKRGVSRNILYDFLDIFSDKEDMPEWKMLKSIADDQDLFFDKVQSVGKVEGGKVYDIEVEEEHCFVANGIVVHNSITSLTVAHELKRKTIVLLHRKRLAYQWQESCNKFFPEWKTGVIGDGKRKWEGCDVVFAVVQTLAHKSSKPFPPEFWRNFGTLIVDEVHVFGAPYFAQVTPRFPCRYVLGMSGTVRRLDGMEDVFKYIIGNQFYKASEKNRLFAKVWVRRTPYESARFIDHLEKPILLNIIAASKKRNQFIAKDIILALQRGRNPLVMSERIDMLTGICEYVEQYAKKLGMNVSHGMYLGGKSDTELEEASKANVVYSTMQLAKEGIDIPCFPGNQLVLSEKGFVEISSITNGDYVYSHLGKLQRVKGVSKKNYSGEMIRINSSNHSEDVIVTPEHVIPVIRVKVCPYAKSIDGRDFNARCKPTCRKVTKEKLYRKKSKGLTYCDLQYFRDYKIEWIKARDLRKGDCVGIPLDWNFSGCEYKILSIGDECNTHSYTLQRGFFGSKFTNQNGVSIKSDILVNRDFLWLLGLFFAEGHTATERNGRIYFSLHKEEKSLVDKVKILMKGFFGLDCVNEREYEGQGVRLIFVNRLVCSFLESLIGRISNAKRIPSFLWDMDEDSVLSFLSGWWWGDGSDGELGQIDITSVSRLAVNDIRMLLFRFGIFSSISSSQRSIRHSICYTLCFNSEYADRLRKFFKYEGSVSRVRVRRSKSWVQFGLCWFSIRSVGKEEWSGEVYNLGVEGDETYLLPQFAVHNCLDTLFLTSPCTDPEQAIGRICRRVEGKKEPIVCDYVDDSIKKFEDSYYRRLKLYKQIGFEVIGDE